MFSVYCGKWLSRKAVLSWVKKRGKFFRRWRRGWSGGAEVAETTVERLLCFRFRRNGKAMGEVGDMSRNESFPQVRISHVLRFISICDLFTDSPSYKNSFHASVTIFWYQLFTTDTLTKVYVPSYSKLWRCIMGCYWQSISHGDHWYYWRHGMGLCQSQMAWRSNRVSCNSASDWGHFYTHTHTHIHDDTICLSSCYKAKYKVNLSRT
jgi:hypothetical protein